MILHQVEACADQIQLVFHIFESAPVKPNIIPVLFYYTEYTLCPWNNKHGLIRIGIQADDVQEKPATNFVLVTDVSGSMMLINKLPLALSAYADMLEGFDAEWTIVPQNSLSSISYTNLPAGDYVFRLAVFDNNQENIIVERTYNITKEKEMYDNNWFIFYMLSVPMFTVGWVTWLLVKRHERKMQEQLEMANRQIEMGKQTVIAIARTVDAKDQRTSDHSKRVAIYSKKIAREYGLDEKQCRDIEWSAHMHDIGKIGIPDAILNKPGRLTDEEYAVMKSHTTRGAEILKDFTLLDNVIDGAQYHHERYDGRGYPKGLKGEEIPLFARIIGVADAFDAMTANRIYRQQMDFSYVLGEMERGRGTQFDPQFVDILLKLIKDGTIDLNEIYHVSREASEQAEKEAAAAKEKETNRQDGSPFSSGSISERKDREEGGKT